MTHFQRAIHSLLISFIFSIFNWIIIDNLLIPISFSKYVLIEIMFIISMKLYLFTLKKTKLL